MELNRKNVKKIIFIIAVSVLMFWGITHISVIYSVIKWAIDILSPFIFGLCLAFVLNLILRPLEKGWLKIWKNKPDFANKTKRPICLILSLLLILGAIALVFFIIIPEVTHTTATIVDMLPQYFDSVKKWWVNLTDSLEKYSVVLPELNIDTTDIIAKLTSFISSSGYEMFDKTINTTAAIVNAVFNLVIGVAFSIYLLAGKEKLLRQLKKVVFAALPEDRAKRLYSFSARVNQSFSNFVTGQVLEAIIIGVLCFVGMLIFGMPYASVVAVLVGVTALIPVFGAFIGTAIGAFLILVVSPVKAFWFVVFIIVLQQLEGNIIYPHVVGKSVGLSGIWVLIAVTIGGSTFGILGMLLSVPLCSIVYVYASEKVNYRLKMKKAAKAASDGAKTENEPQKAENAVSVEE